MRKRFRGNGGLLLIVLGMLMFAFTSGGCGGGGDGDPQGGGGNEQVKPDFVVISEENTFFKELVFDEKIRYIAEENVVSIAYEDEEYAGFGIAPYEIVLFGEKFSKGDVLVMGPSKYSKYGFAGVVEEVQENPGGSWKYLLSQASIEDVLVDGELFFSLDSTISEILGAVSSNSALSSSSSRSSSPTFRELWDALWDPRVVYSVQKTLSPLTIGAADGSLAELRKTIGEHSVGGSVNFNFNTSLTHSLVLALKLKDKLPNQFAIAYPYQITTDIGLGLSGGLNGKAEKILSEPKRVLARILLIIPLAKIPLPLILQLDKITADLEYSLSGTIPYTGYRTVYNNQIAVGWEHEKGFRLERSGGTSQTLSINDGEGYKVEGNFEVSVGPNIVLGIGTKLWGVDLSAGVFSVRPSAGGKIEGKISDGENCFKADLIVKLASQLDLLELFKKYSYGLLDGLKFDIPSIVWPFNIIHVCEHELVGTWRYLNAETISYLRITEVKEIGNEQFRVRLSADEITFASSNPEYGGHGRGAIPPTNINMRLSGGRYEYTAYGLTLSFQVVGEDKNALIEIHDGYRSDLVRVR